MTPRSLPRLLLAAILAGCCGIALAGDGAAMRDLGEYTVHYNAMPANELDPAVARRYDLPQTPDYCVVTVAVVDNESGEPVSAGIMASATRLDGRMYKLDMRAVSEAGGIYYVGELPLDTAYTLEFMLEVRPRPDMPPQTIRFQRTLTP